MAAAAVLGLQASVWPCRLPLGAVAPRGQGPRPGVCCCRARSAGCVVGARSAARAMVPRLHAALAPGLPSREGRAGLGAQLCLPSVRGPYGVSAQQDTGPAGVPSFLLIGCNQGHRVLP